MKEPTVQSIKIYYSPGIPWATKVSIDGKLLVCNLLGRLGDASYPFCDDKEPFDSLVLHIPIYPDNLRGDLLPGIEFEEYQPDSVDVEAEQGWQEFKLAALRQAHAEWEAKQESKQ